MLAVYVKNGFAMLSFIAIVILFLIFGCAYSGQVPTGCKSINVSSVGTVFVKEDRIIGIAHGTNHINPTLSDYIVLSPPDTEQTDIGNVKKVIVGYDVNYDPLMKVQCRENRSSSYYDPNTVICNSGTLIYNLGLIVHFEIDRERWRGGFSDLIDEMKLIVHDVNNNVLCAVSIHES